MFFDNFKNSPASTGGFAERYDNLDGAVRLAGGGLVWKLLAIPYFLLNFLAWTAIGAAFVVVPGLQLFLLGLPLAAVATYIPLLTSSAYTLSAIRAARRRGVPIKKRHSVFQLLFVLDTVDALWLYFRLREAANNRFCKRGESSMSMERCELAHAYHKKGYNCCQSVLAAFSELTGLSEKTCMDIGAGFGGGAGTGELCGAGSGAIMAIGLLTPVDPADPVASKKRTAVLGKELQRRFSEKFGALRCRDLLKNREGDADGSAAARAMGLTGHCDIMVVAAVEILEQLIAEQQA